MRTSPLWGGLGAVPDPVDAAPLRRDRRDAGGRALARLRGQRGARSDL